MEREVIGMEQQTAQQVFAELSHIRETLRRIEQEVEQLAKLVAADGGNLKQEDYLSIVALGASGSSDVSVEHDRYLGKLVANEHLR
jgi:hypothetical protein